MTDDQRAGAGEAIKWADLLWSTRSREVGEDFEVHPTVGALEAHERLCQWIREHADRRASDKREGEAGKSDPLDDLVGRFSAALLDKLKAARVKYGRGEEWSRPDWSAALRGELMRHVLKGDPRDVAAYCAFAWHHGWNVTPERHVLERIAGEPKPAEFYPGQLEHDVRGIIQHASWSEARKVREMLALIAHQAVAELKRPKPAGEAAPLSMILPCPRCRELHVDAPEPEKGWMNPPHKSHLCHYCGLVWRPADVPTNGVAAIATIGKDDNWKPGEKPAGDASGWVSIKDREPELGHAYLTIYEDDDSTQAVRFYSDDNVDSALEWTPMPWDGDEGPQITHWMALPKPPEPKTGEG